MNSINTQSPAAPVRDPFYPNQPAHAFVVIESPSIRVGRVDRGMAGYSLIYDYGHGTVNVTRAEVKELAKQTARKLNDGLSVTPAQAMAASIGSMCGWHVPGANPAEWADLNV